MNKQVHWKTIKRSDPSRWEGFHSKDMSHEEAEQQAKELRGKADVWDVEIIDATPIIGGTDGQ